MNGRPQLSIIIVNHRAEAVLQECLAAIAASDSPLSTEVIIVDNPKDDSREEFDIPNGLNVKRIHTTGRRGFGSACNQGSAESNGECIMLLNPDVILDKQAIYEMYQAMSEKPEGSIVTGRLIGPDGDFQASCRRFPTLGNLFLSRRSLLHKLFGIGGRAYTLPDYGEITEVEAAAAAMMMMSKKTYEALSGFDEAFFLYLEDTDLCYRAAKKELKVYYVPKATGKHYWGLSTGQYRFRRILWHHRSILRYFVKHHRSLPVLFVLSPLLLINCCLSLIAELFTFRK